MVRGKFVPKRNYLIIGNKPIERYRLPHDSRMKISDEKLAEYNGRMNQWIAKQGLIFQLTHGGTGLGGRAPIIGSLVRAGLSLLFLVLIGLVACLGYFIWKATGDELPKTLEKGIAKGLHSSEIKTWGFERDLAAGSYKQIIAEGTSDSFYNTLEARNISFPMEPLNGLFGTWDAKALTFGELKIALKAGEADDERAQSSWQSLFEKRPSFSFSKIEVARTTLSWGYRSPATWGSIVDSQLVANRTPTGWSLLFRGGQFSHGIFRDCQIERIEVELDQEEGLSVQSARLQMGEGSFEWSGKALTGGASPHFQVEGKLLEVPLGKLLPQGILSAVNGTFSGDLTANGSINDVEGIGFQISAKPGGENGLNITKQFPILELLSHLDSNRSYRKICFNQGSFQMSSKGSEFSFNEIDLQSKDSETSQIIAVLKGSFRTYPATPEDLANETIALDEFAKSASETIGVAAGANAPSGENFEKEVINQFRQLQFENPHRGLFYFTKLEDGEDLIKNRLDLIPRRRYRVPSMISGNIDLAVPATAFENSGNLPMVSTQPNWPNLRWIDLNLDRLVLRSSKSLSDRWEESLDQASENTR